MREKLIPLSIAGLMLLGVLGSYIWIQTELQHIYHLKAIGKQVEAEVIKIKVSRSGTTTQSNNYSFFPIVSYEVAGKNYQLESITPKDSRDDVPAVGEKVLVFYNPEKPEEAIFVGEYGESIERDIQTTSRWFLGGICFSVFILFVVIFSRKNEAGVWQVTFRKE